MIGSAAKVLVQLAASDPDRIAIESDEGVVTYGELNTAVDLLAGWIADAVGDSPVAVGVRARSPRQIAVALQAVSRAGHIAVPLDPSSPVDRLEIMVADVEAPLVLTDDPAFLTFPSAVSVRVSGIDDAIAAGRPFGPPAEVSDDAVTAIIFTSGSTGAPKGTMTTQSRSFNMNARYEAAGIGPGTRRFGLPMTGSISNSEAMVTFSILSGATIVYYDIKARGVQPVAQWLRDKKIQYFATVPTMLRLMMDELGADEKWPDLEIVLTWGEGMSWNDVERLQTHLDPSARIVATYGSTESGPATNFVVTSETPIAKGRIPAGKPMGGLVVRILDEDGNEVPAGQEGEIVVVGDIGLGYWKRPDLTAAVFHALPDGSMACWTRDRGRYLASGDLQHLGRIDHMVKISGNRVDLGEVEVALRSVPVIADAAVVAREDDAGDVRLVAFVTSNADAPLDQKSTRARLSRKVPGYMLPDVIVVLPDLPRLPNGKLDRKSLPDHRGYVVAAPVGESRPPETQLQKDLHRIWRSVLGAHHFGIDDRFTDLGGDSIRAARMFAMVDTQLGYDRPVSLLIEAPTIAELAAVLETSDLDSTWHYLLPIKTTGSRPPLFVIHGGGGDVMFAEGISQHLDVDQPVYALRPSVLQGKRSVERSVPELAAAYVAAIRETYPYGPYQIYGYSFGGVVAFEMACQFQAQGDDVSLLAIGDVPAPGFIRAPRPLSGQIKQRLSVVHDQNPASGVVNLSGRVALRVRNVVRDKYRIGRERIAYRRIDHYLAKGMTVPPALRNDFSMKELKGIGANYQPDRKFTGSALLIRSDEMRGGLAYGFTDYGWGRHVSGEIGFVDVPGTHDDLAREHVQAVAVALDAEVAGTSREVASGV
jgi:acyl-coenzyme A synthetase/AMP-(fatty) acid ligase/thioesterase domain-containing protein